MRRILTTALLVLAAGALFGFGSGAEDDSDGDYLVRAAFDNGSFLVPGEEVQEKIMMTPGDVSMLLNETNGLRVQTTSPSLGGANVLVTK